MHYQVFILLGAALNFSAHADTVTRYPSGLFESYYSSGKKAVRSSPDAAMDEFIQKEFSNSRSEFQWEKKHVVRDQTHVHTGFALRYKNRAVVDRGLKMNVHHSGDIDSAVSNFAAPFVLSLPTADVTAEREVALKKRLWKEWEDRLGKISGSIKTEPVIWVDPETNVGYPAFDVRINIDSPWTIRRYIVHEETGNVLEEKKTVRKASASVKVFKVSPYNSGGNNATADSVTLSDLNTTSTLRNSYVWVRRDKTVNGTTSTVEVTPSDFTTCGSGATAWVASPDGTRYAACTDSNNQTGCCNQEFDAVNAYYHISNFRSRINGYLTQLGATVNWTYDAPVNATTGATNTFSVLINPVSLDFGDPGLSDDANNALYVGEPCRSDGSMDRCLVFLRPAALSSTASSSVCGQSSSTLLDLSREAIVVAHEYQHYVTDMITQIAFSSSSSPKVGDAIHEGYSDYMAASYVTALAGTNVTLVGQYALQQCAPLQRQLATLRRYDESDISNKTDIHLPGLSWASAFWKLRTEFGVDVADLLALKSQFFLSTTPGFIESIEAVVKADEAIYAGAHVARIRELFYVDLTFTGKNSLPASGVGEIGFKGCGSVHAAKRPGGSTIFMVVGYFLFLIAFGRRLYQRRVSG